MKKWVIGIGLCGLVMVLGCSVALARENTFVKQVGNVQEVNYVDQDNDGVCDNQGTQVSKGNYVDQDNDGVCDNQGQQSCNHTNHCVRQQRNRNCK